MINSICLVRLSALGDVLMIVPLVRAIQDNFPRATLTWIISRPAYELVASLEGIEFIVIEKPNNIKDYWQFYRRMRYRCFDVLLAAQASFRANFLYPCLRAKRKIGYDKRRAKDRHGWFVNETIVSGEEHTLDGFLKFAQAVGINTPSIRWDIPLKAEDIAWATSYVSSQSPVVLINPAASKPERSWLPSRYVAVIKHLQQHWHTQVILIGGPGAHDQELTQAIEQQVEVMNLAGKTKPAQLLALIHQADLVICPDTGPSHMAAAVSTPVIALHAVTNPAVSGPYNYRHLAVNFYPLALTTFLPKLKKAPTWGAQVHGMDAMKLIPVEAVLNKIDSFFSSRNEL